MNDTAVLRVEIHDEGGDGGPPAGPGRPPGAGPPPFGGMQAPAAMPPHLPPEHVTLGGQKLKFSQLDEPSRRAIMEQLQKEPANRPAEAARGAQEQFALMQEQLQALREIVNHTRLDQQAGRKAKRVATQPGFPTALEGPRLPSGFPAELKGETPPQLRSFEWTDRMRPPPVRDHRQAIMDPGRLPGPGSEQDSGGGAARGMLESYAMSRALGGSAGQAAGALGGLGKAAGVAGAAFAAASAATVLYTKATSFVAKDIQARGAITAAMITGDSDAQARARAARPSPWESVPGIGRIAQANREHREAQVGEKVDRQQAFRDQSDRIAAFSPELIGAQVNRQLAQLQMDQRMAKEMGPELAQLENMRTAREMGMQELQMGANKGQLRKAINEEAERLAVIQGAMGAGPAQQQKALNAIQKQMEGSDSELKDVLKELAVNVKEAMKVFRENQAQQALGMDLENFGAAGKHLRHEVPLEVDPADRAGAMPEIMPPAFRF